MEPLSDKSPPPPAATRRLRCPGLTASATMNHSPLKTALAYECFQDQDNSTLALPSDQKMKTGTSGRQRVQEQVMMTVKRQKPKSSHSSTLSHSNRGSMYDGLTDTYNSYGTSTKSSYYSKSQAGSGSWGYPIYNGTLKREADNRRFSSYSQMDNWGRHYPRGVCSTLGAGSDICFMQKIKASRSEPDLYCDPRGTLRKGTLGGKGHKTTQNRYSFYSTCSGQKATKKCPVRPPSCTSKQDPVCIPPISCNKDMSFGHSRASSKICSEDIECSGLTIPKAVQYLSSQDEKYQAIGAYYIQHTCFQDESAKQQVYQLGGICKLVDLLRSPNQNVQQATAGALRNLVFRSTTNKLETRRQGGIREAVSLLRRSGSAETQKQLTGLLWNLSSTDELKEELIADALPVLADRVVIPFSGCDGNSNLARETVDPEVFFNTTGCLRNLSSADAGRQTMRNYTGLIDALMAYVQNCVAASRCDDKSVENCMCVLHNLSYRLDAEVPTRYRQLEYNTRNAYTEKSSTGCFSNKSDKMVNNNYDCPLPEEETNPKGSSWLYHSDAIRTYLNLMGKSKKDATLEACAGALQNLTASKGLMSNGMSQLIGLKEKGLPQIARLLQSGNSDVVRSGASLLSNMSRHPALHRVMGNQVFPEVTRLLTSHTGNTSNSEDILSSVCYTVRNLMASQPQMARQYFSSGMINNIINLGRSSASPKAAEAARLLLSDMWSCKELQSILRQQGFDRNMLGSLAGANSLRNFTSRF
ncbi:PREDICTED: plakophilin-1 isoform X1 [Hipposideros armiger]|uniref:Plakophilin-1 n=2 Tax=Hipposideros armiger TaxID=186990 RepID=A0A8B7QXH9_HIPAR|nr:PREDICTED: plakophilin-1 isoform X1 [Hipposideros armiger]XP_019493513.1 PREDICTED: plakophilin-1 isoform X1 [Hipposideros armiger]XP_019493514.1 PREDICTED: plakophilin-1 isoform X1 [Hipposideros armiger]XP_019493515.1 PREDICTED: plakophilin-1 isoform X1 [Hipposideros armiger]